MQVNTSAKLNPQVHLGASILHELSISEVSRPIGIYDATHLAPREIDRERRVSLLKNIDEIEKRGRMARFWNARALDRMQEELDDIELVVIDQEKFRNLVPDVAARHALDSWLSGSAYTTVGPFMGLISSVSYSAIANADTNASHAGWTEAGGVNAPTYSGGRKTMAWSAAATRTKSLSSNLSFSFTGAGTVKGCFMVLGTGALATVDNTAGILGSAGLFSADKVVASGDSLSVGYSIAV